VIENQEIQSNQRTQGAKGVKVGILVRTYKKGAKFIRL